MPNSDEEPSRRLECGIRIGADNDRALCRALRNMAFEIEQGQGRSTISGGYDSGYTIRVAERVDETIERERASESTPESEPDGFTIEFVPISEDCRRQLDEIRGRVAARDESTPVSGRELMG